MQTLPIDMAIARIKLWMLRTKLNDLLNQNIDRFVDGRGSGCGSVKQWRDEIADYLSNGELWRLCGGEMAEYEKKASELGIRRDK